MIEHLSSKIRSLLEENRALTVELAAAKARNAVLEAAGPIQDAPAELVCAIRSPSRRPHQPVTIPHDGGRLIAVVDGAGRMPDPRREQAVWDAIQNPPLGEPWLDAYERAHLPAPLQAVVRGDVIVVAGRLSRTEATAVWRATRAAMRRRSLRLERPVMSLGVLAAFAAGLRHAADAARSAASSLAAGAGLVPISAAAAVITAPLAPGIVGELGQPARAPSVERTTPVDRNMPLSPKPSAEPTAGDDSTLEPTPPAPPAPIRTAAPTAVATPNIAPVSPTPIATTAEPEATTTSQPPTEALPTAEPTNAPTVSGGRHHRHRHHRHGWAWPSIYLGG